MKNNYTSVDVKLKRRATKGNDNFGLQVSVPNSLCAPYASIIIHRSVV